VRFLQVTVLATTMKKIAILGATGYIGKSLVREFFSHSKEYELLLFSRSVSKLESFVNSLEPTGSCTVHDLGAFSEGAYDVVLNCTGIGDTAKLKEHTAEVFKITEEMDAMIIAFLEKNPHTLYINISSGAVYGDNFQKPVGHASKSVLNINALTIPEYYAIAKINAEAKHRALAHLRIVDVRVFAFFSQYVDMDAPFLMSQIMRALQDKTVLETKADDIVRDYITPADLFSLIMCILQKEPMNDYFDVYSANPVSKFELLTFFKETYGLQYVVQESTVAHSGLPKNVYYSKNKKAEELGYIPKYSSLEGLRVEIDKMKLA
jgi:nucleoside-diphosphate-sugar epimerase